MNEQRIELDNMVSGGGNSSAPHRNVASGADRETVLRKITLLKQEQASCAIHQDERHALIDQQLTRLYQLLRDLDRMRANIYQTVRPVVKDQM